MAPTVRRGGLVGCAADHRCGDERSGRRREFVPPAARRFARVDGGTLGRGSAARPRRRTAVRSAAGSGSPPTAGGLHRQRWRMSRASTAVREATDTGSAPAAPRVPLPGTPIDRRTLGSARAADRAKRGAGGAAAIGLTPRTSRVMFERLPRDRAERSGIGARPLLENSTACRKSVPKTPSGVLAGRPTVSITWRIPLVRQTSYHSFVECQSTHVRRHSGPSWTAPGRRIQRHSRRV